MKYAWILGAATMLVATPVWAMKVTNLDNVPHKVLFEGSGSKQVREIAPNDTEYFSSDPDGVLSLLTSENPQPSHGTLHADGVLSGIIGAERTDEIPTDSDDDFVIWPGGKLVLQQHQSYQRGNR